MYEYAATVTNVVDGDTVDAELELGFYATIKLRFRLLGVNCPEVHGPSRPKGLEAAAYTRSQLLGKAVVIRTRKADDFGRWLGAITLDGADFNARLVELGYAVPYMVDKTAS